MKRIDDGKSLLVNSQSRTLDRAVSGLISVRRERLSLSLSTPGLRSCRQELYSMRRPLRY